MREAGTGVFITRLLHRAYGSLRSDLFAQGYVLVANQLLSAALGLVYWAVAARLFAPPEIGLASSTISGIMLLGMVSELGIKAALTRYTAQVGASFRGFVIACYSLNVLAGVAVWAVLSISGLITYMIPHIGENRLPLLAAIVISTLFYVQDGVLAAWRKTWIVLIEGLLYNLVKLVLLLALARFGANDPIVLSWFAPMPFFLAAVSLIVFNRSLHQRAIDSHDRESAADYRELVSVVGYDYIGGLLNEASIRLLPLIVFNDLGGAAAAFFFQAWLIANTIRLASGSLTTSFTVVVAASPQTLARNGRRALVHLLLLVVAAVAGLILTAPFLLSILGKAYIENSVGILRLLALSSIPMAVNLWFIAYARLRGWGRSIMINYAIQGIVTVAATLLLAPHFGLEGVGFGCILGQLAAMLQTVGALREVFDAGPTSSSGFSNASQLLRQVDWRFLTERPWPARAACVDPEIGEALKRCGADVVPLGSAGAQCELAFVGDLSAATLAAASSSLASHGALFCRTRFVPVSLARRRLRRAGFLLQGVYVGIPSVRRPRFFLSIPPRRQVVDFLVARALGEPSWPTHLLSRPLGWLLRMLGAAGALPSVGLVAIRGTRDEAGTDATVRYCELGLEGLVTTPGQQAMSAVCAFRWSEAQEDLPHMVVKRARTQQGEALLERRADILTRLAELDLDTAAEVPRLAFLQRVRGSLKLGESFVSGRELSPGTIGEFAELAERITDFAIRLGRATLAPPAARKLSPVCLVDHLERQGLCEPQMAQIARLRLAAVETLPCVLTHNDLTPWNAVTNGKRLGIIDWGEADEAGVPGVDLVCMLFHLAFRSIAADERQAMAPAYRSLLDQPSSEGEIIRACLMRYVEALGIDPATLPLIRLLTWLYHAESELAYVEQEFGLSAIGKLKEGSAMLGLLQVELSPVGEGERAGVPGAGQGKAISSD